MALVALTGLRAEARIARRGGINAVAVGGGAARIATAAERLLDRGSDVVSFGIAGALAPTLATGTLLLPRRVVSEDGTVILVDAAWHARLAQGLRGLGLAFVEGDVLGAARIVSSPEDKQALHGRTGAVAVDLESHVVAAAAERSGCRCAVLRAIADSAALPLPPAALVGVDANGRPAILPVLRSVLARPAQVPELLRLALVMRAALAALERALPALVAAR